MNFCRIEFPNEANFFFEGEEIQAKLQINIEDSVNVSCLTVTFIGVSKCARESPNKGTDQPIWHVVLPTKNEAKKYHFNHPILLYKTNNEKTNALDVGPHEFDFAYCLPEHLPSSLESSEAYTRYFILITGNVDGEIIKKTDYFTVLSKVDLYNFQNLNSPSFVWLYYNVRPAVYALPLGDIFSCGLCHCGNIRAFLHIDKTGYVPGECIKVYAEINNFSSCSVDWVKAALVQSVKYKCSKTIKRKRVVNEILRGAVMPFENQIWRTEGIPIPALPPTTVDNAKALIWITYKLYFQVKLSWQDKAIVSKKKLVMGSIPAQETIRSDEKGQGDLNEFAVSEMETNFEPCFFGPHNVEDEGIFSTFSPMYPVYEDSF